MVIAAIHLITWSVTFGLYTTAVVGLLYVGASPAIVGWLIVEIKQGRIDPAPQPIPKPARAAGDFTFNGLSGSDLVVFNAIKTQPLPGPVPHSKLEFLTGYTDRTIREVTARLVEYGMVARERGDQHGRPYHYCILDDYALPNS